jgi:hypothetical protein
MWCQDAEYVGLARQGEWHYHSMGILLLTSSASWPKHPMMVVDCEYCGWYHKVRVSS